MQLITRFANGLSMLLNSFLLLLKHPILFVYGIIPTIYSVLCNCNFDTAIPFYSCFFKHWIDKVNNAMQKLNVYPTAKYIVPLIVLFFVVLMLCCYIAYIKHVYNLLQNKSASVIAMIQETIQKLRPVVLFAVCYMIVRVLEYMLTPVGNVVSFGVCIIGALCTFFILQIIAIEKSFTIKDIQTSIRLTLKNFIEICAGMAPVLFFVYVLHDLHPFAFVAIVPVQMVIHNFQTQIYLLAKNTKSA